MAEDHTPRLSRKGGRSFALTLAGAFAAVALFADWRSHATVSSMALILSGALLFAALTIPTRLGPLERAWTSFGILLSRITSPVFLGIVYFVVITPAGLIRRMLGKNAIEHRPVLGSYWREREPVDPEVRRRGMERQF